MGLLRCRSIIADQLEEFDGSGEGGDASATSVKAQIFNADGTMVGGEFLVNTLTSDAQGEPTITALSSGGFAVVWGDGSGEGDTSSSGIKAQIFDVDGTKVGDEFLVNTVTSSLQGWSTITSLSSDGFVVSWVDYSAEGASANSPDIKAQVFYLADDRIGTFDSDTLTGDGADNGIYGFSGNDTLNGLQGHDRLDGGTGADAMSGGADDDTYVVDDAGDTVTELLDEGTDEVETSLGYGAFVLHRLNNAYHLGANVENLTGTGLNQGLWGNGLDNVVTAGVGADLINLQDGGNDTANGGDGRDVIYYGATLTAGDTNDGGDEGGDVRGDLMIIQGDYSLTLGAAQLNDIEVLRTLSGTRTDYHDSGTNSYDYTITLSDAAVAAGTRLVIQGQSLQEGEHLIADASAESDGNLQMFGGKDSDILIGGAQFDHLLGRAGDDTLTGNGGDDRLRGGLGGDTMDGGAGADTFVYAAANGAEVYAAVLESTGLSYDTIIGFNFAEDKIDLPGSVSSLAKVDAGALSDASFDADLAAAMQGSLVANGAVLFDVTSGGHSGETFLVVDADGNGSYRAEQDFVIQMWSPIGTAPASPDFFM